MGIDIFKCMNNMNDDIFKSNSVSILLLTSCHDVFMHRKSAKGLIYVSVDCDFGILVIYVAI